MPTFSTATLRESLTWSLSQPVPMAIVAVWALAAVAVGVWLVPRRDRWRRNRLRIMVSLLAVTAGAALLLHGQRPTAQHYAHADEVAADGDGWRGKDLQVHGCVTKVIELAREPGRYLIQIESIASRRAGAIDARYTGLVPDTFREGNEVVLSGRLAPDGTLDVVPDGIMAKCSTMLFPGNIAGACRGPHRSK
jgi:cytochrome c-type biogenesis protein CcmE